MGIVFSTRWEAIADSNWIQSKDSPLKVLHVINGLGQAGAELTLYRLLSAMDRERFESAVVSLLSGGDLHERLEALKVPVHTLGMTNVIGSWKSIWRLVRTIRALQPDIIQGWGYYGNLAAAMGSALAPGSRPVIWNIRHQPNDLSQEKRQTSLAIRLGSLLSWSPVKIIYCATPAAETHEAQGYRSVRRVVIPNGIYLTQFVPWEEARTSVRRELGIREHAPLVGLVARFHPHLFHEGVAHPHDAAVLAEKRSDVHFLMAGKHVDATNESVMGLVDNNGLSNRVHLLGERPDVPRLMAALDIVCCSSRSEGSSNVIKEAMACGVPCVTTDVGDAAWVVGQAGGVVPPRNARALAEACESILALDADERKRLCTQARERVDKLFSLPKMVDAYQQLYEEVAAMAQVT